MRKKRRPGDTHILTVSHEIQRQALAYGSLRFTNLHTQKVGILLDGMKGIQEKFDRLDKMENRIDNLEDKVSALTYKVSSM